MPWNPVPVRVIRKPRPAPDPPRFFTRKQVAQVLRISVCTVSRHIKSGALRAYRIGNRVLIEDKDLAAWLGRQPLLAAKR